MLDRVVRHLIIPAVHPLTEALARMAPLADLWALSSAEGPGATPCIPSAGLRWLRLPMWARTMRQCGPVADQGLDEDRASLAGWGTEMRGRFTSAIGGCRRRSLTGVRGCGRDRAGSVLGGYPMGTVEAALAQSQKSILVNPVRSGEFCRSVFG